MFFLSATPLTSPTSFEEGKREESELLVLWFLNVKYTSSRRELRAWEARRALRIQGFVTFVLSRNKLL